MNKKKSVGNLKEIRNCHKLNSIAKRKEKKNDLK